MIPPGFVAMVIVINKVVAKLPSHRRVSNAAPNMPARLLEAE